MTELDRVWTEMLDIAGHKAAARGEDDLAAYLRLKAGNDAIRSRGVAWLFDTMVELAVERQGRSTGLTIEREEPHRFRRGNSTMVGGALFIRYGVRCLTLAAGWARTPSDGIMRGGALAHASITHFGLSRSNMDLSLMFGESLPVWMAGEEVIDRPELDRHLDILLS